MYRICRFWPTSTEKVEKIILYIVSEVFIALSIDAISVVECESIIIVYTFLEMNSEKVNL